MNSDSAPSYTFDWRFREHARVSTFLMRELFRGIVWRVLGWIFLLALVFIIATLLYLVAVSRGEPAVLLQRIAPSLLQLLICWVFVRNGIGGGYRHGKQDA